MDRCDFDKLKLGDYVHLDGTGHTYSTFSSSKKRNGEDLDSYVIEYIRRYKPQNISLAQFGTIHVESGYATTSDLSKRTDLTWRVRLKLTCNDKYHYGFVILASNHNHMLFANERAISLLK